MPRNSHSDSVGRAQPADSGALGFATERPSSAECRLGKSADSTAYVRWLTKWLAPYTGSVIAEMYCGVWSRDEAVTEIEQAAVGKARIEGWNETIGDAAAAGALAYAEERFARFHSDLRRTIWPLGKAREPGEAILRAADEVNTKYGWSLASVLLEDAAIKIAHAAAKKRSTVRGR